MKFFFATLRSCKNFLLPRFDQRYSSIENRLLIELRLHLSAYRKQIKRVNAENNESTLEEDIVHHIPMAIILPQFPHLTEIYLNFGMIYMDDGFEWRDFE